MLVIMTPIRKIIENIVESLLPPKEKIEPLMENNIRLFFTFNIFTIPICLIMGVIQAIGGDLVRGSISILTGLFLILMQHLIKKTGWFTLFFNIFLAFALSLTFYSLVFVDGGFQNPGNIWLVMTPFSVALFGNIKTTVLWTFLPMVGIILQYHLTSTTGIENALHITISRIFAVLFAGILGVIFRYHQTRLTQKMGEHRDQIRNLLRIICHDLSTPINTITMGIEQGETEEKEAYYAIRKKSFENMKKSAGHIVATLEQVKALEASSSGKASLNLAAIDIEEAIKEAAAIFQHKMDEKNIQLILSLPKGSPKVIAEKVSLTNQILGNIFSNAIKFSKEGSHISITGLEDAENLVIYIKDSGIGIPKDILDIIFDPFAKTSRKGTKGESGTGFGMPIVKTCMDEYGGKVEIESEKDHGTTVYLTFKKAKN